MVFLVATFSVAVPTAVAQTPTADQYQSIPAGGGVSPAGGRGGTAPTGDRGATAPTGDRGATAPTGDHGAAPVDVTHAAPADVRRLPFTGSQVSLVALIGLGVLVLGVVGVAATRRRGASATS